MNKLSKQWANDLKPYKGKAGIYALMCYEDCLYVGQAIDLQVRLITHLRKTPEITSIQVFDWSAMLEGRTFAEHRLLLNDFEIHKIHELRPSLNIQIPKLKGIRWYLENWPESLLGEFIFPNMNLRLKA